MGYFPDDTMRNLLASTVLASLFVAGCATGGKKSPAQYSAHQTTNAIIRWSPTPQSPPYFSYGYELKTFKDGVPVSTNFVREQKSPKGREQSTNKTTYTLNRKRLSTSSFYVLTLRSVVGMEGTYEKIFTEPVVIPVYFGQRNPTNDSVPPFICIDRVDLHYEAGKVTLEGGVFDASDIKRINLEETINSTTGQATKKYPVIYDSRIGRWQAQVNFVDIGIHKLLMTAEDIRGNVAKEGLLLDYNVSLNVDAQSMPSRFIHSQSNFQRR